MPKQFQSNLPIEVMYTAIPLIIVGFIFFYTVNAENKIDALTPNPAVRIRVTGFQWGWSFSYTNAAGKQIALVETAQKRPPLLAASPLSSEYPRFVLPLGETTQITLVSNDVVHTFYVPAFNFGRQALPGVTNEFDFTPVSKGLFVGHCADLLRPLPLRDALQRCCRQPGHVPHLAACRVGLPGGIMTVLAERPVSFGEVPEPEHEHGPSGFLKWVTSTDHKVIGKNYTITAVIFFLFAGAMAMLIRAQLANPDSTFLSQHTYNEMFTMHGSLMIYLFVGPVAFGGLANYIVPLQIGAPDMAFPRLNALSYWLYLGGGLLMMTGFLTTGAAADFGWVAYAPLSNSINTPGAGPDLWIVALILTGFSAIFTGVNLVRRSFICARRG